MAVSTRAPREGDDTDTWLRTVGLATISIHVPREGDDSPPPMWSRCGMDFNPRPP